MGFTNEPISLAPPNEDKPIQILPAESPTASLTPEQVDNKTLKTAYALSGTPAQKSPDEIRADLQTGNEQSLRQNTADLLNADLGAKRYSLMTQALAAKQGPLSADDFKALDTAAGYNFPYTYPVNPNSVFEQEFTNFVW